MKKSKFTEEQIAFALKQADTGTKVPEICRQMGISQATFYAWRKKYGGPGFAYSFLHPPRRSDAVAVRQPFQPPGPPEDLHLHVTSQFALTHWIPAPILALRAMTGTRT
jgi:putative transposase